MPNYNRRCLSESCGWKTDFSLERWDETEKPCPTCGGPTERVWMTKAPAMIPDTYAKPIVDYEMTGERQVHESRSQRRDAMRRAGVRERVQHVGIPGSDKSPVTKRWT